MPRWAAYARRVSSRAGASLRPTVTEGGNIPGANPQSHRKDAAVEAWDRVLRFYRRTLGA